MQNITCVPNNGPAHKIQFRDFQSAFTKNYDRGIIRFGIAIRNFSNILKSRSKKFAIVINKLVKKKEFRFLQKSEKVLQISEIKKNP